MCNVLNINEIIIRSQTTESQKWGLCESLGNESMPRKELH